MLPQNTLSQAHKLKLRWFVTLSSLPLFGVVTAFGIMPQTTFDSSATKTVVAEIILPLANSSRNSNSAFWRSEYVHRGDTVAELLQRLNIDDEAATDYLLKSRQAVSFRKLSIGKEVQSEIAADGSLFTLRYLNNAGEQSILEKTNDSYTHITLPAELDKRVSMASGEIQSSLYAATDMAGLSDPIANQIADIFDAEIDFRRDLRKGDRFTVIYERTYNNGEAIRSGRVLAAEFINKGHSYRAAYFQTGPTSGDYYTPEGKSIHKAFLRSPLAFSRISSGFSLSRFHPVLHKWRSHKGVDYAARTGTKVKVTADGVVTLAGRKGGYGKVIMVKHPGRYTTVYGHLSRFAKGLHRGQHVTQGEVIGRVGMTGLATGPHLHYEFRVNGIQRDPLRVALPDATPINAAQISAFIASTRYLNDRLSLMGHTRLAQLN
ncbi:MAG: M23 family metallopeptidase [Gallionellaceae bacterium]